MGADKPIKSSLTEDRRYSVGITGTGAADPTKRYGPNVTVTRTAAGVYTFTFASYPGRLRGFRYGLGADTPADLAGYTVTRDTFDTDTNSLALSVFDELFAAADLAAAQYLDVEFEFTESSVDGTT